MKIWERHLLGQLVKTFCFILFSLFAIYVIADLSAHGIRFYGKATFQELSLYYLRTFSILLELFLSLTFLLATLRVFFRLTGHGELVALQMAGLSKKKLLRPFFFFATFLSAVCYFNSQWFAPSAQEKSDSFMGICKPRKNKSRAVHVYSLSLEDDSELVYQQFDSEKNELFDVFWVRNPNDIWHMKYLQIEPLAGRFVNHFTRNEKKQLVKQESFAMKEFPNLPWDKEAILHKFVSYDNRSLSTLFLQSMIDSAERPSIFSHLYYKLFTPLMPFLVLIAIAPLCIRFSRSRPLFLIATGSIFGLIALKIILDGMLILGENQALPALIAIGAPIGILLSLSLPAFVRMR